MRACRPDYERYLGRCNEHRFDDLAEFVAADVIINGEAGGRGAYVAGLRAVVVSFPDYRWTLQNLLLDGFWLAAHLIVSGTHLGPWRGIEPTGRHVRVDEFAFYRIDAGRIAEYHGTANNLGVVWQLG